MRVGSLFAGIGGFDIGLERAGMEVIWQVENDDYCNKVLAKHWPNVRRYGDVKEVHGAMAHARCKRVQQRQGFKGRIRQNGLQEINEPERQDMGDEGCPSCLPPVDLICGGFPCQPFSVAGKQRGKEDDRWLWGEMFRVIQEVRPRWVLGENVAGIIRLGLDEVLSDLERADYQTQTFVIPACAVDAPHRRDRVWIVAYIDKNGEPTCSKHDKREISRPMDRSEDVADANGINDDGAEHGAGEVCVELGEPPGLSGCGRGWLPEPDVGRVAHGISSRVDRLRCLGNAVVPQLVEVIGRAIMEADRES